MENFIYLTNSISAIVESKIESCNNNDVELKSKKKQFKISFSETYENDLKVKLNHSELENSDSDSTFMFSASYRETSEDKKFDLFNEFKFYFTKKFDDEKEEYYLIPNFDLNYNPNNSHNISILEVAICALGRVSEGVQKHANLYNVNFDYSRGSTPW
jgi:hypothetical protein